MSDVFVSYARPDEPQAERVAERLRSAGYRVWRDDELPAHRAYGEVIEERLKSAQAVIVLWSAEAAKSQWVRAEADAARELGTLVQATLDGTIPPLPFNQIQSADLSGWRGDGEAPGWRKLQASVAALATPGEQARTAQRSRASSGSVSVCVLPFANMSGDPEQEYFSDGITEDITTDLSKISALEVIARNTAFTFKGQSVNVCDVARALDVTHVLEGSVRKAGNRVRITAQLIDGRTGGHVWAERYDRDLTDIFAIQDEISKAIVAALKLKLLPEEKKAIEQRGTVSAEAYNFYLMARQQWGTGNHGDRRREERIIRLCQCALEIDPNYARAWALLATAQSSLRYGFGVPGDEGVEAAERALSLDPNLAEAYCPIVRQLIEQRRYPEAEEQLAKALALDPDSWEVNKEGLRLHIRQRHFREAAQHQERCVSCMDTDYYGWWTLMSLRRAVGETEGANQAAQIALDQAHAVLSENPNNGAALSVAAHALAHLGDEQGARQLIDRGLRVDAGNLNMRYNFGSALAVALNKPDDAFSHLEAALAKASGTLIRWVEIDPDVDSLRDDPRFEAMLAEAKARSAREQGEPAAI